MAEAPILLTESLAPKDLVQTRLEAWLDQTGATREDRRASIRQYLKQSAIKVVSGHMVHRSWPTSATNRRTIRHADYRLSFHQSTSDANAMKVDHSM